MTNRQYKRPKQKQKQQQQRWMSKSGHLGDSSSYLAASKARAHLGFGFELGSVWLCSVPSTLSLSTRMVSQTERKVGFESERGGYLTLFDLEHTTTGNEPTRRVSMNESKFMPSLPCSCSSLAACFFFLFLFLWPLLYLNLVLSRLHFCLSAASSRVHQPGLGWSGSWSIDEVTAVQCVV